MKRTKAHLLIFLSLSVLILGCAKDRAITREKMDAKKDLGTVLVQDGEIQRGLKELLEAAEMDPTDAELQNYIGHTYLLSLRKFDKAAFHFKKALALRPEFPEAQNNLGNAYAELKKWDMAIDLFKKAIENDTYPTPHIAYNNIGKVYHHKGAYRKAIENYKKAVGLFLKYSPAYDNMGLAYEMMQEWDLAIESYKKAIECSPDIALSHLRLGRLYMKLDRYKEATEELFETIRADAKGRYAREARALLDRIKISDTVKSISK